jgi:hypothetical protein
MKYIIVQIDNHVHDGKPAPFGTVIKVNDKTAARMIAAGNAMDAGQTETKPTETETETQEQ